MSNFTNRIFKDKPYFCPAPFTSLVQDYNGRAGPCPYSSGRYDFRSVPISERWRDQQVEKLREQHLNGEKPEICRRCYTEEESGFHSRRQMEQTHFLKYSEDDILKGVYKKGPKTMVIRVSNHCNYACRTCHSLDSSLFKAEGDFYAKTYGDVSSRYFQEDPRREFTPEEMDQIFEMCGSLNALEFYGGEPLLNTSHHYLLEKLIASDRAKYTSLYYCTNGSHEFTQERRSLWSRFRSLRFQFSLDGIDKNYHYIRWPGNWEKTEKNVKGYLHELPKMILPKIDCGVNITVSSLNIFYMPEIISKMIDLFPPDEELGMTTVHQPVYYSVVNIPERCKKIITERLQKSPHSARFQGLINFMNSRPCDPAAWKEFVLWTEKKDKYRGLSIAEYLPEFFEIIRPEYIEALGDFKAVSKPR